MGKKVVEIARIAAEDYVKEGLPGHIDCAFTSPPYFSTELYNAGGEYENDQSWKRYSTYEEWRDKFYLPVNEALFENLNNKGILIVNIQDPKVNGIRYRASDDLINHLTTKYTDCNFIGNMGMRLMTRPRNIEKTKLLSLYDKLYIEPMWCFGKNRKELFPKQNGLLDFI
jgi:hypothetical protein